MKKGFRHWRCDEFIPNIGNDDRKDYRKAYSEIEIECVKFANAQLEHAIWQNTF